MLQLTKDKRDIINAVKNSDILLVEKLLKAGVDPNTKEPDSGLTLLMISSGCGNIDIVKLLLAYGADVNIIDNYAGTSALHKAAQKGDVETAKLLLSSGAFLDLQTPTYGHTPLLDAIWYKNAAMAKFLLAQGANLNIYTKYGITVQEFMESSLKVNLQGKEELMEIKKAIDERIKSDNETIKNQKLMNAVKNNDYESIKKLAEDKTLLEARYPVVSSYDDGYTPMLVAARDNHPEVVKELLSAGANPRARDTVFCSEPIHKATYMGNSEIAEILIDSGKIDINVQGYMNGYTPLHDALWHGNTDTAMVLLNAGARVDIKAHDGITALDIAIKVYGKNHEIINIIKQKMQ